MAADTIIWHHPTVVTNHSLYNGFGSSLTSISDRDYPSRNYINYEVPALDMDSYEASLDGNNDCTVDAVVGICNERQGKPVAGRHLLVELRMDYENVDNLDIANISRKYAHTIDLLKECSDHVPVDSSLCLLFDSKIESQAIRWLARKKSELSKINGWLVFTPNTFGNHINVGRAMPYTPKPETIETGKRFIKKVSEKNLDLLDLEFKIFRDYIDKCRQRYEKGECAHLMGCLSTCLDNYNMESLDKENDEILVAIFREDMEDLFRSLQTWIIA